MIAFIVFTIMTSHLSPTAASSANIFDRRGRNAVQPCSKDEEYLNDRCCLKCPPGTRMTSACTQPGTPVTCEECEVGTFTAHANTLSKCFRCTQCPPEQEIVQSCTLTQDTKCQCKKGYFCAPDQPCEVCKQCSRCRVDEETVKNCTETQDTECKAIRPPSDQTTAISIAVPVILVLALLGGIVGLLVYWKTKRPKDSRVKIQDSEISTEDEWNRKRQTPKCTNPSWPAVSVSNAVTSEDERQYLCDSLSTSASNSQHSLTSSPSTGSTAPPRQAYTAVPKFPMTRDDDLLLNLVPVAGDLSLRQCFTYFEDLNIDYYKRFFRLLGISDNVIKALDYAPYEERIHELLNIWMEKMGKNASLNDLLKAMLALDQKLTAEQIKKHALESGHYIIENLVDNPAPETVSHSHFTPEQPGVVL